MYEKLHRLASQAASLIVSFKFFQFIYIIPIKVKAISVSQIFEILFFLLAQIWNEYCN